MASVKIIRSEQKALKAVVGNGGVGIFFRTDSNEVSFWCPSTRTLIGQSNRTLEEVLVADKGRNPVYEGDVIQIKF